MHDNSEAADEGGHSGANAKPPKENEFRAVLTDMDELRKVKFPRSITPSKSKFKGC
jgi:hypothetical protein